MGAYSPAPVVTGAMAEKIMDQVVRPIVAAMAAGRGVIGCRASGLRDTVVDAEEGRTGVLFAAPTVAGIVAGLCRVLADRGVNIAELTTRSQPGPGGAQSYELQVLAEVPDSVDVPALRAALEQAAGAAGARSRRTRSTRPWGFRMSSAWARKYRPRGHWRWSMRPAPVTQSGPHRRWAVRSPSARSRSPCRI